MSEDEPSSISEDDPLERYYGYQVTRRRIDPGQIPARQIDPFGNSTATPLEIRDAIDAALLLNQQRQRRQK